MDEAVAHFDRSRTASRIEPQDRGSISPTEPLNKRGGRDFGGDIGIDQPEGRAIKKPGGPAQRSTRTLDFRFKRKGDVQVRHRRMADQVQNLAGQVMAVDQDVPNSPTGEQSQGVDEQRPAPERHEGFGEIARQRQHPGTQPGGEHKRFARQLTPLHDRKTTRPRHRRQSGVADANGIR